MASYSIGWSRSPKSSTWRLNAKVGANPWSASNGIAMRDVIVVIGAGQIGQAIARRVGVGKHVVLADMRPENANAAAEVLGDAGYDVSVATVDASSRAAVDALVKTATGLGDVTGLIHAAGVSPTQA